MPLRRGNRGRGRFTDFPRKFTFSEVGRQAGAECNSAICGSVRMAKRRASLCASYSYGSAQIRGDFLTPGSWLLTPHSRFKIPDSRFLTPLRSRVGVQSGQQVGDAEERAKADEGEVCRAPAAGSRGQTGSSRVFEALIDTRGSLMTKHQVLLAWVSNRFTGAGKRCQLTPLPLRLIRPPRD